MEYVPVNEENRKQVNAFFSKHWNTTNLIILGMNIDMTQADGIIAQENGKIMGLLTYMVSGSVVEITSLNSVVNGIGVGTALLNRLIEWAKENQCKKIVVVTSNDNIQAMCFYQKRGFDMERLYHNSLELSRAKRPRIPLVGPNGILLKHELEFVLDL